ncbi:MAG: class I adenylate cyclase [Pseudomonadota bacterium]
MGILKKRKPPETVPAADDAGDRRRNIQRILRRNRRIFANYQAFRQSLFAELAPEDSEAVLYLLPWLLSINEPQCPGFIAQIKHPFRVYGIDYEKGIQDREPQFKRRFGVTRKGTLLREAADYRTILGLYTIGSVGSVSQTSGSDCDIWVCIDKESFDRASWQQLNMKINLIRDWFDMNIRMPAYFFLSDISAIQSCQFGSVDSESSGSTQQNVLKEEFYRSFMVICGKIPLWWLCWDPRENIDYPEAVAAVADEAFGEYDLVDLGDISRIKKREYFGAALWQLNKSLSRPLKSILKMSLLKMLLDAPPARLMCHQFRDQVLSTPVGEPFPDYSVFTMEAVAEDYRNHRADQLTFLIESLYIRCEVNPYNTKQPMKNRLASGFFKPYGFSKEALARLRRAASWPLKQQIQFGDDLFSLLLGIYRETASQHAGVVGESDHRDMTILGRKISAYYLKKKYKLPVLQRPTGVLNIPGVTFSLNEGTWQVLAGNDSANPICTSTDIVYTIAFTVWNNLFSMSQVRMRPNPSSMTLQEIMNLGGRIKQCFGSFETADIDYGNYLRDEQIVRLLVVVGLEKSPWQKDKLDFGVVYLNGWGELFARGFATARAYDKFLLALRANNPHLEPSFYVRRNATSYEQIIERTKLILRSNLGGVAAL